MDGGPLLEWRERIGPKERVIRTPKFRTHRVVYNITGKDYESELTLFGSFIRPYSLDELPAFFSVLRGDLTLIGPKSLYQRVTRAENDDDGGDLET